MSMHKGLEAPPEAQEHKLPKTELSLSDCKSKQKKKSGLDNSGLELGDGLFNVCYQTLFPKLMFLIKL